MCNPPSERWVFGCGYYHYHNPHACKGFEARSGKCTVMNKLVEFSSHEHLKTVKCPDKYCGVCTFGFKERDKLEVKYYFDDPNVERISAMRRDMVRMEEENWQRRGEIEDGEIDEEIEGKGGVKGKEKGKGKEKEKGKQEQGVGKKQAEVKEVDMSTGRQTRRATAKEQDQEIKGTSGPSQGSGKGK